MITTTQRRFLLQNIMDPDCDREAVVLKWWILSRLLKGETNADQIYMESECGDQAMYLALHRLVKSKFVVGISPYDESIHGLTHRGWMYRLADNASAKRLAEIAVLKAVSWNPHLWEVNTVVPIEQDIAQN